MISLICAWINHREAGDLRRHRAHYDVIVMVALIFKSLIPEHMLQIKIMGISGETVVR